MITDAPNGNFFGINQSRMSGENRVYRKPSLFGIISDNPQNLRTIINGGKKAKLLYKTILYWR